MTCELSHHTTEFAGRLRRATVTLQRFRLPEAYLQYTNTRELSFFCPNSFAYVTLQYSSISVFRRFQSHFLVILSTTKLSQGLGKAGSGRGWGSADSLKFGAEVKYCIWRLFQ